MVERLVRKKGEIKYEMITTTNALVITVLWKASLVFLTP